ncbi:MAG: xylulokinase [Rhodobacteraceae bacterium]|nr:MAG: xylulokinase [Paracoccaceae bacterium]
MYLGLDLGTSGLKAIVIDDTQRLVASASAAIDGSRPHPGWSEQDPADWIGATESALTDIASKIDMAAIKAIGLSGHMHGATLIDTAGDILRPCIMWNDTRAHAEAAELDADPDFRRISGNIVFPGFTAPKLLWISRNEPEIFSRVAKVLLPKDYLRLWLTGEIVSEMSDAAGTSWLDTGARDWSDTLLSKTGLDRAAMPSLVEGSSISGELRKELAARFGFSPGTPVAGGAGDNAASAIGLGVVAPGQAFVSLGTSGVLFAANESYRPDPETAVHTFCHAVPDVWHQMGVILAATDALNWFGRFVGRDAADLTGDLGQLQAPGQTVFLPYLGGERTPLNDAAVRGAFVGLAHATDQSAGTRAVLEGVTFALRDCRDALAATGTTFERLTAVGGGARSDYWLRAIATALDCPVDVPSSAELGAALGAARLAMMAASGDTTKIATPPEIDRIVEPDAGLGAAFDDGMSRYRAARDAIGALA